MEVTQTCSRCKRQLSVNEFYKCASGKRYTCKKCDMEYSRNYNRTHPVFRKEYEREYARTRSKRRWSHARLASHRRRGFKVFIIGKELFQLASGTDSCFVCGCALDWQLGNKGSWKSNSPTLNRLDNGDIVTKENVAILCYRCNATKRDRSLGEFVAYCNDVAIKFYSHLEYPQLPQ